MLSNLQSAKNYLAALERGIDNETLAAFLSPDVVAETFPNRLQPEGTTRNYAALLAAHEQNRQTYASQRYEVRRTMASGDTIAIEFAWSGVTAAPFAGVAAGAELRAQVALFLEFRGGRIVRQRSYDNFFSGSF